MIRFLERECPHLWALLNQRAKRKLPDGIVEFLSGPDASVGEEWLTLADTRIVGLIGKTSQTIVDDAYRRRLSSVKTADALSELLCELTLVDALGGISSSPPNLQPTGQSGSRCDVSVVIGGRPLYGEVKRLADRWLDRPLAADRRQSTPRAIVKSAKRRHVDRPRAMDLISKLKKEEVYRQLPAGTLNILFLFHPSGGSTHLYIELALFGDPPISSRSNQRAVQPDGLYALSDWRNISACAHSRVKPSGALSIERIWKNPMANVVLPDSIEKALHLAH